MKRKCTVCKRSRHNKKTCPSKKSRKDREDDELYEDYEEELERSEDDGDNDNGQPAESAEDLRDTPEQNISSFSVSANERNYENVGSSNNTQSEDVSQWWRSPYKS